VATNTAGAPKPEAIRPDNPFEDQTTSERGLAIIRLDPKAGARPGECDELAAADLSILVGKRAAKVVSVERVPRPERHWLMLDISESAEDRRLEAMRSAAQYVANVMITGEDRAALIIVDQDAVLGARPSTDMVQVQKEIDAVQSGGWSALRDSLDVVLRQIQGDRHEHVVLFWTDGDDQSSMNSNEDLMKAIARTPNATIFPICLLPSGATFPRAHEAGAVFYDVARASAGETFVSTDPRWLERVRGWLERRFTVAFVPPEGIDAGRKPPLITVPGKACEVTILRDPFARPDSIAGEAPPPPPSWKRMHAKTLEADDDGCATGRDGSWGWPLRVDSTELTGCVLDVSRTGGPIVREREDRLIYTDQSPRFAAREVRIAAPALPELPTDVVAAVESISPNEPGDPWNPSPYFMDGQALVMQRAHIAASLFAARPDLHEFAITRLTRSAKDELRAIERDFARAFPELNPAELADVARASRAGKRALAAARTPTDTDLANVLAAWIGDLGADELMRRLELRLIDARVSGGPDGMAEKRWLSVRSRFAVPVRNRIIVPLALIHDPAQDVVGFVRIVLPRPESFRKAALGTKKDPISTSDRIAKRPIGLGLVDLLASEADVAAALAKGGYRAVSLGYSGLDPEFRSEPARPYVHARVMVELEGRARADGSRPKAVLEADVRASREGPVAIAEFTPVVTGDPELAALLTRFRATRRRRSRPSRGPCCGPRRGSSRATAARD
jgi:hypothetical protein